VSDGKLDQVMARREVRIQGWGREIVSTLYMLIRNVKIHSPDNAVFVKPIEKLCGVINTVIASDRRVNIQAIDTHVYLNNTALKFDFNALEMVKYLTTELESRDLGGFLAERPITSKEIRDFLFLFTGERKGAADELGDEGHELDSIRLSQFRKVKEILDKLQEEPDLDQQIDRKKYLLTVYARAVFFMRKYIEKVRGRDYSIPLAKAGRLVQDLVDLCAEQRTHFLGLTTTKAAEDDYLAHHSVNTCLIAIVVGAELGLDKRQLHELGMSALFSQVGISTLPKSIIERTGGLTPEEREQVDLHPLRTAKTILAARGLDPNTMMRVVSAYESHVDYFRARQSPQTGQVELVPPKLGIGPYGRIIALAECYDALTSKRPFREAYGPQVALALMSSQLEQRFDPDLLRVFMKTLAIQPIRILDPGTRVAVVQ